MPPQQVRPVRVLLSQPVLAQVRVGPAVLAPPAQGLLRVLVLVPVALPELPVQVALPRLPVPVQPQEQLFPQPGLPAQQALVVSGG